MRGAPPSPIVMYLDEKGFSVRIINLALGRTDEIPLSEYLK